MLGIIDRERTEQRAPLLDPAVKDVHVAEKVHHERACGVLEHLDRAGVLLDLAFVHDHDAVGELERLFLIVRHEHARQVNLFVQPPQPAAQLLPHFRVERAERLVEQQHFWLDGQRARERDALTLAAGKLGRMSIAKIVELHQLQQIRHFRR